jgi:hypothetical protein
MLPIHGKRSVDKISMLPIHGQGSVDLKKWSKSQGKKHCFDFLMMGFLLHDD